jgi:hypothetical protein
MEPSATRSHHPCCWPRFWQSAESLGHCWATNHTTMQWLRLHTHPKLLAHQCQYGAHMRCMIHFICSGWAYGTIGNPLPLPLLTQILTVCWKLGSLLGYNPYHYAVVEAPYPSKLLAHQCGPHIRCFIHFICSGSGWAYGAISNPFHCACWPRFW